MFSFDEMTLWYTNIRQENFFPKYNVRYIAITDGVDNLIRQEMDTRRIRISLTILYSRDISKKVLAGRMARSRQGKFGDGPIPFGLMRDPEDRGHLIIDPETAPVIRKIYDMAPDGWGSVRISKKLMGDKILGFLPIKKIRFFQLKISFRNPILSECVDKFIKLWNNKSESSDMSRN